VFPGARATNLLRRLGCSLDAEGRFGGPGGGDQLMCLPVNVCLGAAARSVVTYLLVGLLQPLRGRLRLALALRRPAFEKPTLPARVQPATPSAPPGPQRPAGPQAVQFPSAIPFFDPALAGASAPTGRRGQQSGPPARAALPEAQRNLALMLEVLIRLPPHPSRKPETARGLTAGVGQGFPRRAGGGSWRQAGVAA